MVSSAYLIAMDDKWFKQQQKRAGVSTEEIAERLGRHFSVVSRIYVGRQQMTMDQARVFADVLKVPLDEVVRRAGILSPPQSQEFAPGFAESDAVAWQGPEPDRRRANSVAQALGLDRPGVDVWTVKGSAMALQGLLPGDLLLVDLNASELARAGDVVIAQRYDHTAGTATTLLRRYEPPVLVAASADPEDRKVHVVDGDNVVIRGKVVASWRT